MSLSICFDKVFRENLEVFFGHPVEHLLKASEGTLSSLASAPYVWTARGGAGGRGAVVLPRRGLLWDNWLLFALHPRIMASTWRP